MNRHFTALLLAAIAYLAFGCATTEQPNISGSLIGTWRGIAPDNSVVVYKFFENGDAIWSVQGYGSTKCKYQVNSNTQPTQIDITDFSLPQLVGVKFEGIISLFDNQLTLEGVPIKDGLDPDGNPASRPFTFTSESITFTRI